MKKNVAILICLCMMFVNIQAFALELVDVVLDGEVMEFDVPAQIIDDRTMVPMRAIFEELGAEVEWMDEGELIFAIKDTKVITMKIGQSFFTIGNIFTDYSYQKELDVAPMLVDDRTLVPVRAVAESLDCTVDWDEANQTVIITTITE